MVEFQIYRSNAAFAAVLVAVLLVSLVGCTEPEVGETPTAPPVSLENVTLSVLVIDDPALAAAIDRRRGEWIALTEGDFKISEMSSAEFLASGSLSADVAIYPSQYLGHLAERGLVVPVRERTLEKEGYDPAEVFELVRRSETRWGSETMALPLGSPVFALLYRADLFARTNQSPPTTWGEYQALVEFFSERSNLGDAAPDANETWYATAEPRANDWGAKLLLARSAAYVRHRSAYSALFDIDTMEPLIADPPFVRALEELATAARASGTRRLEPAEARAALRRGHCAMAITWPTAADNEANERLQAASVGEIAFAELPGARQVFEPRGRTWETRDEDDAGRVPTLGIAGRLGSVSAASRDVPAAFRLLAWLVQGDLSTRICASSPATTLFRQPHLAAPRAWVDSTIDGAAAAEYAERTQAAFGRQIWLNVPRLPGVDEYHAALATSVEEAVAGERNAAEALQHVAVQWREITGRLGLEEQKAAYRRSLGLDR